MRFPLAEKVRKSLSMIILRVEFWLGFCQFHGSDLSEKGINYLISLIFDKFD